jgi:hypothetical protein
MNDLLPTLALSAIVAVVGVVLYIWQRNQNAFDLKDMLVGSDGKASINKFGQATALVISSWGFITLVQHDKMTEYYFIGYMTVWSGVNLAKTIFAPREPKKEASNAP